MLPHLYDVAIVDGVTQFRQGHVQLVHPCERFSVFPNTLLSRFFYLFFFFVLVTLSRSLLYLIEDYLSAMFGKQLLKRNNCTESLFFNDAV